MSVLWNCRNCRRPKNSKLIHTESYTRESSICTEKLALKHKLHFITRNYSNFLEKMFSGKAISNLVKVHTRK